MDDSPLPNCPIRDVVLTGRDKQLLTELRRASAMALPRCVVSRYATAWAESLEGAMSGHQSWALLCRYHCRLLLAEIPKGVDRNSELKQRLHLWESGANQCSDRQGPGSAEFWAAPQHSRKDAAADRRTAREASLCLDSPRLYQQSHEGTGRRCCAGLNRLPKELDHSPHSARLGHRNAHPTSAECAEAARTAWGGGRYKLARSEMREQGRGKTGNASLPHVKLSPMSAPGPAGDRLEHLERHCLSFAGAGQRRRLLRGLDTLTIKWAVGDLPEECRFVLNAQLMFLKKEKNPTSKQFDDDEWIRSLAEVQEVMTDIPEDSVTYDQQDVDPKKVRPIQMGEFLRKYVSRRLLALSEGETAADRIWHHSRFQKLWTSYRPIFTNISKYVSNTFLLLKKLPFQIHFYY